MDLCDSGRNSIVILPCYSSGSLTGSTRQSISSGHLFEIPKRTFLFEVAPLKRFLFSRQRCSSWSRYEQYISAQQTCLLSSLHATGGQTPRLYSCCCCASSVRNRTTHIRRVVLVDSVRITHGGIGGRYRSASRFAEIWLIFRAR